MSLRDDFHTQVYHSVTQFERLIKTLDANPKTKSLLDQAPSGVVKGRTFAQMAFDDTMRAFEKIMKDVPANAIPVDFYLQLARKRDGMQVSMADARARLTAGITAARAVKPSPKEDHMPDFLKVIVQEAELPAVQNVANAWSILVQNLGNLTQTDESIISRRNSVEIANTMADKVNDLLAQRVQNERSMRPQPQLPMPTGGVPLPGAKLAGLEPRAKMLLETFGEDITAIAKNAPEVIDRDQKISEVLAATNQKERPFAMVVGAAGAGKSSVTMGVAKRIVDGNVPAKLKDAKVIRIKLKELRASSGQAQRMDERTGEAAIIDQYNDRLFTMLREVANFNAKGGKQIILNIDELGEIAARQMAAVQTKDVVSAVMNSMPGLRLIGEISDQKFNQAQPDGREFLAQFQKVDLKPLSDESVTKLIDKAAKDLQAETGIATPTGLYDKIRKMSSRYIPGSAQPSGSIELLEAAVAYAEVYGAKELGEEHVVNIISNITGVPKEFIGSEVSTRILTLGEELPKMVMGQPEATTKLTANLEIANGNLQDPNRPLGSFMLIGPTGVGKTETAKALAKHLGVPLITEDMSNYKDQHAKAKLVGAPPGYVGFDKEAAFEKVEKSPYCVLLLDEIEKAHPDVFDTLLSVLDEGRLQLMNGKTVDFRNVVLLMTSNVGAKEAEFNSSRSSPGIGGGAAKGSAAQDEKETYERSVRDMFKPEFLGRLDSIITYNRLAPEVARMIVAKKVKEVSEFLNEKNENLKLELSPEAKEELFTLGYDPRYGARPMNRAIKDFIKQPLSKWIIGNSKSVTEPTVLYVKSLKGEFNMEVRKAPPAPATPAPSTAPGPAAPRL